MELYACPQCKSKEWIRMEVIKTDSKGLAIKVESAGIFRCGSCNTRVQIDNSNGSISPVMLSAKSAVTANKVRSSMNSDRADRVIEERKF